ncbi:peptidoglycan-binding protein [Laspinema sp. D1]|uniref:peptidoglycan-binding domain-containing protein n=1 Tax=Laspinema palackyanum TaxID=3231601 RepID=UPI00348F6CBE|nr:peptidoglycan-binding protein [Laspinema sp. D2b]
MDAFADIQVWLIWQEQDGELELSNFEIPSILWLVFFIALFLAPLTDLHPVLGAEILKRGSQGQDVLKLQNNLKQIGCFPHSVRSTGYYGRTTKNAVIKLQQINALKVDGVVGEQTGSALKSGKTCQSLASSKVLKMGSRGKNVSHLQVQLNNWGFPVQKVDGVFGKETRGAVIRFQNYHGLKPDGIVGPKTAKVLWTDRTLVSKSEAAQSFYDTDTYEQAFMDSISESDGQPYVILTFNKFLIIKSAIFDKNQDKKIQYKAAILLARKIYQDNFEKNWPDFNKEPKNCKSRSCIDKAEIYITKNIFIDLENTEEEPTQEAIQEVTQEVPIDEIKLILNQAFNQEEDLLYRFLAASAMPYIREAHSKDIINILGEKLINTPRILNPVSEEELENNNIMNQALESLELFSEYADDSSSFEDVIPVLNRLIMSEHLMPEYSDRTSPRWILGNLAAIGNHEAFKSLILLIKAKTKLEFKDVFPLKIATNNPVIAEKMSAENKDEINLLKIFISQSNLNNDDYLAVGSVASILMSVGEEEFVVNLLEKNILEKIKLEIAETIYNDSQNNKSKEKSLITIIDLYKKNPKWDDDNQRYPACVLYSIGQPSVEKLENVKQENLRNQKLKNDIERLLKSIENPTEKAPCQDVGGGIGWVIGKIFKRR